MYYTLDSEPNKKFTNIRFARKFAVDSFAYWRDMGIPNPYISVFEGNAVGQWRIGYIYKGRGYPVYEDKDGMKYRISKDGNVRKLRGSTEKEWHPFGL